MGLRMATSLCPFLSRFKPMARFHEPFSKPFYTVYRATSFYLLEQYFRGRESSQEAVDFKGLQEFYENINIVNARMAERLNAAEIMDATQNSIAILSVFSASLTDLFDDYLEALEGLFLSERGKQEP